MPNICSKLPSHPIKAIVREVGYQTKSSFTNAFTEKGRLNITQKINACRNGMRFYVFHD